MQRWPAVPTAAKATARSGEVEIRLRRDDHRIVAAQFQERPPEPTRDGLSHRAAHPATPRRRDQGQPRIGRDHLADLGSSHAEGEDPRATVGLGNLMRDLLHGQGGQGGLGRGFPDRRVAADGGDRRVPGPDGDREVERRDDPDRPERVPLLDHPVPRPLAGDRQAVELPRQADGEVAHVDHLLDLAFPLRADLARLQRHEQAQLPLPLAEGLPELPDHLPAPRGRDPPPALERRPGLLRDPPVIVDRAHPDPT